MILCLLDGFDDILIEPFVPDPKGVALDVCVLVRLTGLDVLDRDAQFLIPDQQLATDVFRAVVDPYRARLAPPFDVEEDQEAVRGTVSPTTCPNCG